MMYGFNPYQQSYTQQNTVQDERIWVQNEISADAYLVAPNGFVRLWDANKPRFYEKRADGTGRPCPLECYEYKKISLVDERNTSAGSTIGNDVIEGLTRRIEALEEVIHNDKSDADDSGV